MMQSFVRQSLRVCLIVIAIGTSSAAFALPTNVSVAPPDGARFLVNQKFDLRVEGKGTGPYSATLAIDGAPQSFTSGAQNTTFTDNISSPGYGGFNLRGYFNNAPGTHTITTSFTDSTGTVNISAQFQIIDARGTLKPAKNIIILLGDGMGVAHRTAARLVKYGVTAGHPNGFLAMEQFPGTGLITTHSLNTIITDSAPGMAGYSTGNHSNNNQEGVYPANVINPFYAPRVEYMAEYLHRTMGKSLGLVTTADVEDATPAANAIHTANRNAGTGICDQYLDESDAGGTGRFGTGLSVLMGGGRRWFLPGSKYGSSRSASTDYAGLPADLIAAWNLPASAAGAADPNRYLLQDFVNAGFAYVDSSTALNNVISNGAPNKLLGLFGYGNMNVTLDKIAKRRNQLLPGTTTFAVDDYHAPDQPMLNEMTDAALPVLAKNGNGFVLMVEGAHIDKQSHAMDADRVIDETIEFDNAVASARRFADAAGDTVVIVLADHECAGFSLIGALTGGINNLKNLPPDNAKLDPSVQPERQKVVGTADAAGFPRYTILADGYPQTFDIDGKILVGYGASADRYEGWLQKPLPVIDSLLSSNIRAELATKGYPGEPIDRSENRFGFFIRGQAVGRGQAVHTASDIPVSAYSSGSNAYQQFYGVQENTDVFFKLMRAAMGGY
jgi:alkaline phosphatase